MHLMRFLGAQCVSFSKQAASLLMWRNDCRALGAGQDLKEFDCDNKLGLVALKRIFEDIIGRQSAMPEVTVHSRCFKYIKPCCRASVHCLK